MSILQKEPWFAHKVLAVLHFYFVGRHAFFHPKKDSNIFKTLQLIVNLISVFIAVHQILVADFSWKRLADFLYVFLEDVLIMLNLTS